MIIKNFDDFKDTEIEIDEVEKSLDNIEDDNDSLSEKKAFTTGIKKKRKSESSAIDDKYRKNIDRIKKMRKMASKKFSDKSVDITIRNIESKIKRYEIRVAEKELEILRMRDQKIMFKKELANAKERISRKKSSKKKKK